MLRISTEGAVACLTLAAPETRNALSLAMMEALSNAFAALGKTPGINAIILAAEGPAFSSGHDLKEMTRARETPDCGYAFFTETLTQCAALMQAIVAAPQPVIAAVEGVATAAGAQMVASCDLAIAGAHAHFCTPGVNIGLFCSTPSVALSRAVSRKNAMEMLLLGDQIDAEEARRMGLVNRVTAPGQALAEAQRLAARIADKSAYAVSLGKRAFYAQAELPLADAYKSASQSMLENMLAEDAIEGIAAFLGKRQPVWRKTRG